MSLTIEAPASSAARATSDFVVSTESGVLTRFASASITGTTRAISSSTETGSPPGRVDSPPISMISAPSEIISSARARALSRERNCPPSLKLSGVTLRMPMMSVRSSMGIVRCLICQTRPTNLGRLRIASRDWRKNRLERLRSRFLELRPILIATGFNGRILVERQARDNPSNLNAVERLAFKQALRQTNHRLAILFDDRLGSFKLGRDDLLDLLVDLDRCVFGEIAMLGDLTSEEDLLFLLAKREWSHLGHAVLTNHRSSE